VAIGLATAAFARYLGDLGVTSHFLVARSVNREMWQTGALVAALLALTWTGTIIVAAGPIASLLHSPPGGANLIRVISLGFLFEAPRFGPVVRLSRAVDFGRIGAIGLGEAAALYGSQILFLALGAAAWGLALSQVARALVGSYLYVARGGGAVMPARRGPIFPMMRQALPYQGTAILMGLTGFLLPALLATVLDARNLGYWAWATVLATPIAAYVGVISSVALPSLARLRQADPPSVERATVLAMRGSVLVPAVGAGMLFGFSDPIVHLVYGTTWDPALAAVKVDLFGVVPFTFAFFLGAVLASDQRPVRRLVAFTVGLLVGVPGVLILGTLDGPTGASIATAILVPLADAIVLWRLADVRVTRAFTNGVGAFAVAGLISWSLAHFATSVQALVFLGTASAPVAVAVVWVTDRTAARALLRWGVRLPRRLSELLGV
jgi:O-antigen/teichoic acid export membrane protein